MKPIYTIWLGFVLFGASSEKGLIRTNAWQLLTRRLPTPTFQSRLLGTRTSASSSTTTVVEKVVSYVEEILQGKDTIHSKKTILERINQRHVEDCILSTTLLAAEETCRNPSKSSSAAAAAASIEFEEIRTLTDGHRIACRSLQPLLNASSIAILRKSAEAQWQSDNGGTKSSRFTYQRPGNYEAHVADLGYNVKDIINELLLREIYPMIRRHFWNEPDARLCVYDSLYIRYNATEARQQQQQQPRCTESSTMGAGQPFHRDLGIVSVNLMLNNPETDFVGGGTFFENQLRENDQGRDESDGSMRPLKPLGPGYCLAHYSAERHAGAATQSGVRDILVIFVTAEKKPPPLLVQAALLKQSRDQCVCQDDAKDETTGEDEASKILHCRLLVQSMAVSANPNDGEALQYLANALIDYADYAFATTPDDDAVTKCKRALDNALDALREASLRIPCDWRVFNTLGRTYARLWKLTQDSRLLTDIRKAYERSIHLLEVSERMGCQVNEELDSVRFNFGLHLTNQDLFAEALSVLEPVAQKYDESIRQSRIYHDARSLCQFCRRKT